MAKNKTLNTAKAAKKDEFYTQLHDIEAELRHYWPHFAGKTILCNCDDPYESNFFKYFALNFNLLKLKRLIATCYDGSVIGGTQMELFDEVEPSPTRETPPSRETKPLASYEKEKIHSKTRVPHKIVINELGDFNGDGSEDLRDIVYSLQQNKRNTLTRLEGNGDFRSAECVALLKEADIVVTNPPFSLFREYVAQLVEHQKKFLIIGNKNAIKYREIFPLIQANKMWIGCTPMSIDLLFDIPDHYLTEMMQNKKAGSAYRLVGDSIKARASAIWFTNLDHKKRHEEMILFKKYSPERYRSYDNFDGIDVPNTADIPCDYPGMMGVPITFLDKFNPEQFEIIGLSTGDIAKSIGVTKNYRGRTDVQYTVNGVPKCPYERLIIRNKHPQEGL